MQQTTFEPSQAYLIIQLGRRWTDILRLQPEQPVLVGRSSENQVVVKDDRVSRNHAKISFQKGGWVIEDLGSRNGTQVNGKTISQVHPLNGAEEIVVGGCRMTFTHQLTGVFATVAAAANDENQATIDGPPADIVNRLSNSQWSKELDANTWRLGNDSKSHQWSFFYRLVFDLVQCKSEEDAASIALDRLLEEIKSTAGGVLTFVGPQAETPSSKPSTEKGPKAEDELKLAVLAARQLPGSSYHRVSDFLVKTILKDKQAVLARNVQDDSQLSVARSSGQREIASSLCAPLRVRSANQDTVIGLIHIYSPAGQRMLTAEDLDLAVGVADNLALAISRFREQQKLNIDLDATRRKVDLLEQQLALSSELIGNSAPMLRVKQTIQRVGPSQATVLVRGESGSGKELVARAIHQASSRKSGPLICLNCAALAPSLLESELFGHEKGAFTGATERKIGKFEAANKGTLFLDEVGEMPAELQAKFLRVLEGHPFERLGGNSAIHTDVRVVAATNRDLEEAVQEKLFRSDLYFRLRVVEITLPPLRQRPDDIPGLVEHFINLFRQHASRRIAGISPEAMELLVRHRWPGNVRELRNVIERAVVLGTENSIVVEDLGLQQSAVPMAAAQPSLDAMPAFEPLTLDEIEKAHILGMLKYVQGNKSRAAQLLGIERSTLDRKLKRFSES